MYRNVTDNQRELINNAIHQNEIAKHQSRLALIQGGIAGGLMGATVQHLLTPKRARFAVFLTAAITVPLGISACLCAKRARRAYDDIENTRLRLEKENPELMKILQQK
ncbi:MAG: hypothetical protein WC707_01640 [Candidatus Babeliaceae bacterium]|jgi:hypothetical protein